MHYKILEYSFNLHSFIASWVVLHKSHSFENFWFPGGHIGKKRKRRKPLLLSKHSLTSKCYFFSATKSSLAFNFHSNFFVGTSFKPQQKKVQKFAKLCTARHTLMLLLRRQIIIFLTFLFYLHLTKVELVKLPSVMSGSAFSTNLRSIFHLFLGFWKRINTSN